MLGYTEYRTTQIWVELSEDVNQLDIVYKTKNINDSTHHNTYSTNKGNLTSGPYKISLINLQAGETYLYTITAHNKAGHTQSLSNEFSTRALLSYKEPPSFSFITGSCAYFTDDENAKHIGDKSIFETMSNTDADFMIWLGDNWYTREEDYHSEWGLYNRAHKVRKTKKLQPLLAAMPNYAIWDDHDYGPNNAGSAYILKEATTDVFKSYWCNPSYGENNEGIYTQLRYYDVAFFLLDDRTWRSSENMKDSIDGKANPDKLMFGKQQMSWLKNALLQSKGSSFKIIVTGSQMTNTYSPYDCFYHFPVEFSELMNFISDNNIEGVVFLTGDRHHSEILKYERSGKYPLYEMTISPLTSRLYNASGAEKDMPIRIKKVEGVHNYGKISITGDYKSRKLTLNYYDKDGKLLESWSIDQKDLKD